MRDKRVFFVTFVRYTILTMQIKRKYSKPQTELTSIYSMSQILEDSNTETFEGGGDDDITW